MRALLYAAGCGMAIAGLGVFAGWFLFCAYQWATVIVPWFWKQGNYWPAAISMGIALFAAGVLLASATDGGKK